MCDPVTIGLAISAVGAATSIASAEQQRSAGNKSKDQAKQAADAQEQAFNKENGKRPDLGAMSDQNALDAKAGPSGTLLTGPSGVDPNKLLLGRTTLLGG